MLSFSFPHLNNGSYWMTVLKLLHNKTEMADSQCSTCLKMGYVTAMIQKGYFTLWAFRVIFLSGGLSSTVA